MFQVYQCVVGVVEVGNYVEEFGVCSGQYLFQCVDIQVVVICWYVGYFGVVQFECLDGGKEGGCFGEYCVVFVDQYFVQQIQFLL